MKFLPKIALVLTAAASCAAGAATVLTPEQDQARRDQNREEALTAYHASAQGQGDTAVYNSSGSAKMSHTAHADTGWKAKTKHAEDKIQADAASAGHTVATKTDKATKPVQDFTHRQLNKVRNFSARQDAKYGKSTSNQNGDAIK